MKKLALIVLGIFFGSTAWANDQTKVVVGYGPGGTDTIIRTLSADAEMHSGTKFRVENRPGANGVISLREYFKETPSRDSLLGVTGGQILFEPLVNPDNNFINRLRFVGPVLTSPLAIAVRADSDLKSAADLFDRSKPRRRINIAVGGESHQMLVSLIAQHSHHDVQGVRFKGGADGFTALKGGHVDAQVDVYGFFTTHVPSITILGVAQARSMPLAPSLHRHVPDATLVNFFAVAVNRDVADYNSIAQSYQAGFVKSGRAAQWERQGYEVDMNSRSDFVERSVVPAFIKWKKWLNNQPAKIN